MSSMAFQIGERLAVEHTSLTYLFGQCTQLQSTGIDNNPGQNTQSSNISNSSIRYEQDAAFLSDQGALQVRLQSMAA